MCSVLAEPGEELAQGGISAEHRALAARSVLLKLELGVS